MLQCQNVAPIAYEDIVQAHAAAKRRISLPGATRETDSTVHPENSRAGSRDSLPSKQEARPPIAVPRGGKDQRIFKQGKDKGGKVHRVSDTCIDGEPKRDSRLSMSYIYERFCADYAVGSAP